MVELKEAIWTTVEPTHLLWMDISSRLTSLEKNSAQIEAAMREELRVIPKDLTSVEQHMFGLSQSLSIAPTQLRTLTKRMDIMEELLGRVHEDLREEPPEPDPYLWLD